MVVIIYAYSGLLTGLLVTPKFEPIVESIDDLVAGGKFLLTEEKNAFITRDFLVIFSH